MIKIPKYIILVLFVIFQTNLYAQFADSGCTAAEYSTKGDKFREEGKNKEALACYQAALIYDPYDYLNNMKAAISNHTLDYYANMIYYFEQVIIYSGESYQSYGNLGSIYAEMGYDKEAFMYLEKALNENPDYAHVLNNMGAILMRYDKYDEARGYLRKANKLNPKMPDPLHNIGNSYLENNQLDSALFYYNKAIEVNHGFSKSLAAKASTLKKMNADLKEYEGICNKLIGYYTKIIKNQPDNYEARKMRADIYSILGNNADMQKDMEMKLQKLNKLIELHPNAYAFLESRGNTFKSLGNTDAAIKDYEKVLEINPEYKYIEKKVKELDKKK